MKVRPERPKGLGRVRNRKDFPEKRAVCREGFGKSPAAVAEIPTYILLLHNIRSVHNAGSIFRTADAVGIARIILSGYTPEPIDRFGRERADFHKAALGAEKTVPWMRVANPRAAILALKKEGYQVVAIEQSPDSTDYRKVRAPHTTLFMLGNEVRGLSHSLLALADTVAEIPLHGSKESLNVSVAAGVALFRMLGR